MIIDFRKLFLFLFLISCTSIQHSYLPNTGHQKISFYEFKNNTHQAHSTKFIATSQGKHTSLCAREIYAQGGNIIDSFVAASFAISVERPQSTGLGGGGFLLYYDAKQKKHFVYDFRESAPGKASSEMFLDSSKNVTPDLSLTGGLASGVPGLVKGLYSIHQKHGKLPWKKLLTCSIKLAEKGFAVYPELSTIIAEKKERLLKFPGNEIFFAPDKAPLKVDEVLYQKDLAKTLKIIQRRGADGFYQGEVAKSILRTQQKYGGIITQNDLRHYQVKQRSPIIGNFRGYKIVTMPPPSSGGTHILQMLNILENFELKKSGPQSAQNIHLTASAMQMAFADRAKYLGDTDFTEVPIDQLISKKYAAHLSQKISMTKALSLADFPLSPAEFKESTETTHFTLMDEHHNVVATTQTINGHFGSAVMVEGTGVIMNNEMDDFATKVGASNLFGAVGGERNLIAPHKRPLSSMSPTIVFENDQPILALGSPNGTRIISCVLLTILNYIEYGFSLEDSIRLSRYHHQWSPDALHYDPEHWDPAVLNDLTKMGHQVVPKPIGCRVQAVAWKDGLLTGASDLRGEGASVGQ